MCVYILNTFALMMNLSSFIVYNDFEVNPSGPPENFTPGSLGPWEFLPSESPDGQSSIITCSSLSGLIRQYQISPNGKVQQIGVQHMKQHPYIS